MLAYVDAIIRKNAITIDGYTSNKTEHGIVSDVAKAIEKYDKGEADFLREILKIGIDEYNNPFVKNNYDGDSYCFEYEEVPCATRYNEKTDEMEYKEGYHNYFLIRIIR